MAKAGALYKVELIYDELINSAEMILRLIFNVGLLRSAWNNQEIMDGWMNRAFFFANDRRLSFVRAFREIASRSLQFEDYSRLDYVWKTAIHVIIRSSHVSSWWGGEEKVFLVKVAFMQIKFRSIKSFTIPTH